MRRLWRVLVLGFFVVGGCVPATAAPIQSALTITGVVPEPNATAVLYDSTVYVQFNHPVVPLTTLDHPGVEQPLQIAPPLDGWGKWINTGLFTFTPKVGWAPETTYQLSVPRAGYRWTFTTLPPAVARTTPPPSAQLVDPNAAVRVQFNQPLDHGSVQLTLEPRASGRTDWPDQRTLVFAADGGLTADTPYLAVASIAGREHRWTFRTAPLPAVVGSVPLQDQEAPKRGQVELTFSAPMDRDDVRAHVGIEPMPDSSPFVYWNTDDTHATVFAPLKASTAYTLTLPAGVKDKFGRQIHSDFRLEFTTPASQVSPNAPPVTPSAWLIGPGTIGTYDAYEHPRAFVRTTNVGHVDYRVDRLDQATVLRVLGRQQPGTTSLPDGELIQTGGADIAFERNIPTLTELDFGPLEPGYYRARIEPGERAAPVQDRLVVVTRTMLAVKESPSQTLAWATDLRSGEPLAGVRVDVFRPGEATPLASGVTDDAGAVQLAATSSPQAPNIVLAERTDDASLAQSTWSGRVGPWTFGLRFDGRLNSYIGHLYTDRPIYRPGQAVHLKGVVRADDDAQYSLPAPDVVFSWRVRDSRGQVIGSRTAMALSDFGTFDADVDIDSEGATGAYSVQLTQGEVTIGSASFLVADYRRPTYEVRIDGPAALVASQPLRDSVHAAYYFGQPLSGADVHWQVMAEPYRFTWPADPTFRFGDGDEWLRRASPGAANAARSEGKGLTSADGGFDFQVPTDLSRDLVSQRFTVEATVADKDSGDVSNRATIVVHKADTYIGLKPTTFVSIAGRNQSIELVTLGIDASPRGHVGVHGQVVRRRWMSIQERDANGDLHWVSRPADTPISAFDTRTDDAGRGTFDFTPAEGGQYRIVVETPDEIGNLAHTALDVWVADTTYVPWRIADDGRLELQADKPAYQPGDIAHVLVPAPVDTATALVSVERGKLISYRVQHLTSNSTVLDIPIGLEHVPNAYVSVVLFAPGEKPTAWTGYVELSVAAATQTLQVSVDPDARDHRPGDDMDVTIHARDASGSGMPAELSVAMVDAAVLALVDSKSDPVDAFWHRRPASVRSGSSLGVSIDRINDAVASGRKGGGGGSSSSVRQDFPDTAFWAASVRTDGAGLAHVRIHLPDSLTTWRLTVVAITRETRVGVGTGEVVTAKPLLVRPITPRFMVGGDVVTLGAVIHNTTSAPLAVAVSARATLLELDAPNPPNTVVPPGGRAIVTWHARSTPGSTGQAGVQFEARTADGQTQDAIQVSLPLLAWGVPTTVATAGEVAAADATTETIDLPPDVDRQRGEVHVQVTPSLAAAMQYAAHQVEFYPYLCLEQTVSRFLPGLALQRAVTRLGLGDPMHVSATLPALVSSSVQRIYRLQHDDGGWGLWEDDPSSPYFTAYALFGLAQARQAGYAVEQAVVDRGVAYLRKWLNGDPGAYGLDGRAFVLYALGGVGAGEPARASALFDRRAELSALGKALLAQSLFAADPRDARVGGLLSELSNMAVVSPTGSHWEDSRGAAMRWLLATDVRTTAAVLDALVRLQPGHPLIASTVRWMLAERTDADGYWRSTHDSATALIALAQYLETSGELQGTFTWQLAVNGHPRQSATVDDVGTRLQQSNVLIPNAELRIGRNSIDLTRTAGPGRLYYTLQFKTYSPAEDMPFLSHGFTVAREYLAPNGDPSGEVHVGDLVRVRLTVIAPTDLHDVVLEDPLPAGLEPLDQRLRTTSRAQTSTSAPQAWNHVDVLADRVALFANYLRAGTYTYTYVARASSAGEFRVLPTSAREQYFPDVQARADGRRFTVLP